MKNKLTFLLSSSIFLFLVSVSDAQFYSLRTKYLQAVCYDQASAYLVPHLARCFENALQFHRHLFDYTPTQEVTVVLQDFRDIGYGGAETIPWNLIEIGIEPFNYSYETVFANERLNWMMNHELAHIVTMDKAAGRDQFFRSVFGGKVYPAAENPTSMLYSYLTNPRRFSPRWYLEGIAVFLETWMAGGLGRALSGYDEMVFRTMVRDSSYFYDVVGLESEGTAIDFQVGANSYLYGTRFVSYLAYQYGPEKLIRWVSRTPTSRPYFAAQFKKIYGTSLDDEWSRWIEFEHQWQRANLDSIRLHPTTPYRPLSRKALGSQSRTFYDPTNRKLYAAIRYPGQIAHLATIDIDRGTFEKLCEVKGAALYYVSSLAYDHSRRKIFFTTDNNGWRDLNVFDIQTGKAKTLLKDARTGDLAFNQADESIWGVRHYLGISTLVRIPFPYKEWKQIYSLPYGKDIFDLDISPDGKVITAALAEVNGKQSLIKMEVEKLLTGETGYEVLFDFETSSPETFVFSPNGKWSFGSSYYSGVSNIYRYDFETKAMRVISNCETGFFRPAPVSDDSLIVLCYTGKGFVPVMIANAPVDTVSATNYLGQGIVEKHPLVKSWIVGSPASINLDSLTTSSGAYRPLANIKFNSAYPIVEGYKDFAAVGLRLNFADRIGFSGFDLTTSYSPDQDLPDGEKAHVGLSFYHWGWQMRATYNDADFYDLFGPTKISRKGYSLSLQYKKNLLYDEPRTLDFKIKAAGYGGLEKLPDYQNISTSFDKFLSLSTGLNYQYLRKSLGAVDDEKGFKWEIISQNHYVNAKFFPRVYSNFDYGIPLALNHSSIWWRSSLGYSFGDRDEPFANFFFGGFGNNWVDHLAEKRYREYYSFPGVELNAIGGTNYGKAMLEWTLPPLRFRRLGMPNFYCNWARFALFSSGLVTNVDSPKSRRELLNAGGQIDFRLVMLSHLSTTLSFGYAAAVEKNRRLAKEFMISLKIL
ncbi:MAG: hypothetical protein ONB44_16095 [candidate division KSB1 bacterium]|nr:hypothetical protein [candidate division KSB1 bacterium]MDZ7303655.1 hypothetical protein [candidate division KSB1 bacterium]MDZ7313325.1 hypothetical protein [candidate division KSB1 bacterium]